MPEYIERKALIKDIESRRLVFKTTITVEEALLSQGNVIRKAIEEAPTADVVEVVRCKDCEHLTVHNSPTLYAYCEKTQLRFEPFKTDTRTHFCSYGKRKED